MTPAVHSEAMELIVAGLALALAVCLPLMLALLVCDEMHSHRAGADEGGHQSPR